MAKASGLNTWLHRTAQQYLTNISSGDMGRRFAPEIFWDASGEPTSNANWIHAPDVSAVSGWPTKYWIVTGDVVTLMNQAARDAVDAAALSDTRDAKASPYDDVEEPLRALTLMLLDEINDISTKINGILSAIDTGSNLAEIKTAIAAIVDRPIRTISEAKQGFRNRLGS